ncbi:MAG: N-acetyltransferase [Alphaproteobacteria bacterium]|nr:N-acetyltransferase [Alphaproteobacteria bacterium]
MGEGAGKLTVRIVKSIAQVDAAAWDACANPAPGKLESTLESIPQTAGSVSQKERFNPFVSHAFLHAVEASGSAAPKAGWSPVHVLVEDEAGQLAACAPAYLKTHSMGEYVFDYAWADAYERAGGRYYPKLQVCAPFTPVQGRRLLVAPGGQAASARAHLIAGLRALRDRAEASSLHITFPDKADYDALGAAGFLQRTNKQFHFFNRGYLTFEDFLTRLSSRKRKTIRRERRDALAGNGIEVEMLTGAALREEHWDAFFAFYMDTGSRKWGRPYLTRGYYSQIGETMADRILLVMAKRGGRYIAGAINFIGDDALYGRNWGCIEDHPFLHFELCYYRAIDFAIKRGLARVEAGAQGEHKLARGYEPVTTYSAHDIAHPGLARAVKDFLDHERAEIARVIEVYGEHVPFRKDAAREAALEQDF